MDASPTTHSRAASSDKPDASGQAALAQATAVAGTTKDKIRVGSKAIVCQDADIRGEVTIGAGCILHPKCTILAYSGPIVLGDSCIVEENAVILNGSAQTMVIGQFNHFEVGCRVEAAEIGSYNVFEPKSRVHSNIRIADNCVVGAGCTLIADSIDGGETGTASALPTKKTEGLVEAVQQPSRASDDLQTIVEARLPAISLQKPLEEHSPADSAAIGEDGIQKTRPAGIAYIEDIPSYTVIFGSKNERGTWSGEGRVQQVALLHKHLAYLTETLPKYSRLKMFT